MSPKKLLKSEITFRITLIFLILLKLFKFELIDAISMILYPVLIGSLWLIAVVTLAVSSIFILFKKHDTVILYLSCTCILLFPLDEIYERSRFYILRPQMELCAMDIATEYQYEHTNDIDVYTISLPENFRHLSRGTGRIICCLCENSIKVSFYKCPGLIDYSEQYVFSTEIPFLGTTRATYSYLSDPSYVVEWNDICENWYYLKTG